MSLRDRVRSGWNAFMNKDPTINGPANYGISYSRRPDRIRLNHSNEKSIVTSVYNRMAVDAASYEIKHVRLDENGRYKETINSTLNTCLTLDANVDQTGRALRQDAYMSMFDEGVVAVVPVDYDDNPYDDNPQILTLRVGKIVEWMPKHVRVRLYDENSGQFKEIIVPKAFTLIVENPFYAVMNEPNSTAQRLIRKLALLDIVDENNGAGKLDLIIQLPYTIKTEAQRKVAENRKKDIEMQLATSKYGIAYTDGTEHITQLNRSVENQLLDQIKDLKDTLYSQLSITEEIMNGTADESVMNNYINRTIEPVLSAFVDEAKRKFLTQTARARQQSIVYFNSPFRLVPVSQLAEMADKFTRNEILTANEVRQAIGYAPSADPKADELRNSNISAAKGEQRFTVDGDVVSEGEKTITEGGN